MPDDVKSAVEQFSYWLGTESLGMAPDLDTAENYLFDRTINNPKSKFHSDYVTVEDGKYKKYTQMDAIYRCVNYFRIARSMIFQSASYAK